MERIRTVSLPAHSHFRWFVVNHGEVLDRVVSILEHPVQLAPYPMFEISGVHFFFGDPAEQDFAFLEARFAFAEQLIPVPVTLARSAEQDRGGPPTSALVESCRSLERGTPLRACPILTFSILNPKTAFRYSPFRGWG